MLMMKHPTTFITTGAYGNPRVPKLPYNALWNEYRAGTPSKPPVAT
jgi:hypothetical protein